jgi:LysR family nod box-dependent transcriptional activator
MARIRSANSARHAMHFRHLDLNLLVALDALLVERNITLAGKRVHLSQSAMSGALSRLREYFHDELLTQVGRKMVLTPLAQTLEAPVRRILLEIEATLVTTPTFNPLTAERSFKLMMSDYVATVLMSEALPRIERLAPGVKLEILSNDVDSPFEALDRADIDLLIMPQRYLGDDHPCEALFEDEFVGVAWRENAAIAADGRVSMEDYLRLGHVTARFASARAATIDDWFVSQLGHERRVELVTMSFTAIFSSIIGTQRVATVHRRLAQYFQRYLPIRLSALPLAVPALTEAVQWHQQFDADPGIAWLRGVLKQAALAIPGA